jgi:hypothetical protein
VVIVEDWGEGERERENWRKGKRRSFPLKREREGGEEREV